MEIKQSSPFYKFLDKIGLFDPPYLEPFVKTETIKKHLGYEVYLLQVTFLQDIFETFLKPYPRFRGRLYIVTTPHREGGDDFISTTKTEAEKFYQNMVRRCDLIKG